MVTFLFLLGAAAILLILSGYLGALFLLILLGAMLCKGYASEEGPFTGAIGALMLIMTAGFVAGLRPSEIPVYGVNPTQEIGVAVVLGMASFGIGVLSFYRRPQLLAGPVAYRRLLARRPDGERTARVLVMGAIFLAVANYASGQVPILAPDINDARFAVTDPGIFDSYWVIILPLLQVGVLVGLVGRIFPGAVPQRPWLWIGSISFILLALSASRSLALLPIAGAAFLWVESRRPSLLKLAAGAVSVLAIIGLIGALRGQPTRDVPDDITDRVITSMSQAVQTSPRVWTLAARVVGPGGTEGALLASDLANMFSPEVERSDRQVTQIIGRDINVIGGSPPTVWGGLFLDFGQLGVVIGGFVLGAAASLSRLWLYRSNSPASAVWFAYLAAYLAQSTYSYVSVRPSWIVVGLVAAFAFKYEDRDPIEDLDGIEVSRIYRRS